MALALHVNHTSLVILELAAMLFLGVYASAG